MNEDLHAGFAHLYQVYYPMVYRRAYAIVHQREEAEDAAQETFLRAYKTLATFDPARGALSSWLSRIATHTALDLVHYRHPRPPVLSLDGLSVPLAGQEAADPQTRYTGKHAHLAEILAQLPARYRYVLRLRCAGYTEAEIGAAVGKTARTVRTWLKQARVQLAQDGEVVG